MSYVIAFCAVNDKDLSSVTVKARVDAVTAGDAYERLRMEMGNRIINAGGHVAEIVGDYARDVVRCEVEREVARRVAEKFEGMPRPEDRPASLSEAVREIADHATQMLAKLIETDAALGMSSNAIANHLALIDATTRMKAWKAVLANCEVLMRAE